jgi:hypothetical protein
MRKKTLITVLLVAASCSLSHGAPKKPTIGGRLQVLSTVTGREVSQARVGSLLKLKFSDTNLHLLANQKVTINYVLSATPEGSKTPISFSGKITCKATLLPSDGGAAATTSGMAFLAGTQSDELVVSIPEYMPTGNATLTVSVSAPGVGTVALSKTMKITL